MGAAASIRYITGAFTSPPCSHPSPLSLSQAVFPPIFPSSPSPISRPISSIQRGCLSPVRPLMPPLSWGGACAQATLLPLASVPSSRYQAPFFPRNFQPPLSLPPLLSALPSPRPSYEEVADAQPLCPRVKSRLARDYSEIICFCKDTWKKISFPSSFL